MGGSEIRRFVYQKWPKHFLPLTKFDFPPEDSLSTPGGGGQRKRGGGVTFPPPFSCPKTSLVIAIRHRPLVQPNTTTNHCRESARRLSTHRQRQGTGCANKHQNLG